MKRKSLLPLLAVLVLGCSESQASFREEAGDVWEEMRTYTVESSERFKAEAEAQLDRFSNAMDELGDQAAETTEVASEDLEDFRAEVAGRMDELRDELQDIGDASKETWSEARDRIVDALEELADLVEKRTSTS
jgi:ElaB/YqjD/DUF883 family membrane-anchored ribosome-binding protein